MTNLFTADVALSRVKPYFSRITRIDIEIFLKVAVSEGICFQTLYDYLQNRNDITSQQLAHTLDKLMGSSRSAPGLRFSLLARKGADRGYYLSDTGRTWFYAISRS